MRFSRNTSQLLSRTPVYTGDATYIRLSLLATSSCSLTSSKRGKTLDLKKDPDKNYRNLEKPMAKLFKTYPPHASKI